MRDRSPGTRRRELLGALGAAALGSTAGCVDFLSRFAWSGPNSLSLTIATLPANVDTAAVQMAHQLSDNLEAAGVDSRVEPQSEGQLLRTVLMENNYDLFITRHPGIGDPDRLRSLLHTRFSEEAGWQNPFGFNAPAVDDLLERQRVQSGQRRFETVVDLQQRFLERQPFSVLAYPEELSVVDAELDSGRTPEGLLQGVDYLRFAAANPSIDSLQVGILSSDITRNRNPIAVDHHSRDETLELLYEPLVRQIDGERVPWLAEDVSWVSDAPETTVRVTLRRGLQWHDDEPLDAVDAAFTYQFLQDTALDDDETVVPAPQFRRISSIVESASAASNRTVELTFGETSREVALDALTVPLLPRHVWTEQTDLVREYMTQALVWDNPEPVGSGPFQFESANPGQEIVLTPFEDHFLYDDGVDARVEQFAEESFEEIVFTVFPQSLVLIGDVQTGETHIGASTIRPGDATVAEDQSNVELLTGERGEFYMLGFNTRNHPLSNHQFRRAVGRLIDRDHSVNTIMDGYGSPADSPLERTDFVTDQFSWQSTSNLGPFPGEDGQADRDRSREMFQNAGFRYSDGQLVTQD
jgi:peptide/nickel transport system substrate-binding protein